ncbi:MAG TPA: Clp1/GlmU family protein [Chthonomonadales bacterium]|nr:Clp1/GlmU family protein [Chthonomonadales bacterium]
MGDAVSDEYGDWTPALEACAPGVVMLVGDVDTGKSTLAGLLASACAEAGLRTAVVDADLGQSEIGPPTCVGFAMVAERVERLSDLAPHALSFVGSCSPAGAGMEVTVATVSMVRAAREQGAETVIVDTCGMVRGPAGRRLKQAQMAAVRPDTVVILERAAECAHVVAPLRYSRHTRVFRLPVPACIQRKSAVLRTHRRAARFARYFDGAEAMSLSMDEVALSGTWVTGGQALEPHLRRFASRALGVEVYHAERGDAFAGLVTSREPRDPQGVQVVQQQLQVTSMVVTPVARLLHLVVGLDDGEGRWVGIGSVDRIGFARRMLTVMTPVRSSGAVRHVRFGLLRVQPDGTELGANRPGEV